jgi:hypothetical protein
MIFSENRFTFPDHAVSAAIGLNGGCEPDMIRFRRNDASRGNGGKGEREWH